VPYQEGRPLTSITEEGGNIKLVDYSSSSYEYSLECQICMASISDPDDKVSELGNQYDNKLLADISTD
jgi:hypothetical protein